MPPPPLLIPASPRFFGHRPTDLCTPKDRQNRLSSPKPASTLGGANTCLTFEGIFSSLTYLAQSRNFEETRSRPLTRKPKQSNITIGYPLRPAAAIASRFLTSSLFAVASSISCLANSCISIACSPTSASWLCWRAAYVARACPMRWLNLAASIIKIATRWSRARIALSRWTIRRLSWHSFGGC